MFNCYRGLVYEDVYLRDNAKIDLHPQFVLLIGINGDSIRILQSVQGFKKLGSPVTLQTLCQRPIERIAVNTLGLSIADVEQLLIILMLFVIVTCIIIYKMYQAFSDKPDEP